MAMGIAVLLSASGGCKSTDNMKEVDISIFGVGIEVEYYEPRETVVGGDWKMRDRD